ncbi:MAG: tetratricopeptide repeat protein [Deltaproteobacteria bacterium]|nr:tetratricopeptide repeat protein [Candidatus Anaeroferrophillus wilburensis]MBN2888287.1 tetratricopeptide repeat protein [Deltaproteobacteria bacterium]
MSFILAAIILLVFLLGLFWFRLKKSRQSSSSQSPSRSATPSASQLAEDHDTLIRSYFRGLSYVLSNETDRAVAEFVKVAQVSSATSEIYLALGQLFRNTGEVDRAIRVHSNLLLRSSLPAEVELQTFFEIGLDYKKAGLIDRARKTFEELHEKAPTYVDALVQLESIYEMGQEWDKAIGTQKKLTDLRGGEENNHIIAHLTTEMAKEAEQQGEVGKAATLYQRAIGIHEACIDAWLHLGDLHLKNGKEREAIKAWEKGFVLNPDLVSLAVSRFSQLSPEPAMQAKEAFFATHLAAYGENIPFVLCYISFLMDHGSIDKAIPWMKKILDKEPGCIRMVEQISKLVSSRENCAEHHEILQAFFASYRPDSKPYQCRNCGYLLNKIVWKCPKCAHWDTIGPY